MRSGLRHFTYDAEFKVRHYGNFGNLVVFGDWNFCQLMAGSGTCILSEQKTISRSMDGDSLALVSAFLDV